jgi:hypothetical protein
LDTNQHTDAASPRIQRLYNVTKNHPAHYEKSSDFTTKVAVQATNADTQLLALFQINVYVKSLTKNNWPDGMRKWGKPSVVLEVRKMTRFPSIYSVNSPLHKS